MSSPTKTFLNTIGKHLLSEDPTPEPAPAAPAPVPAEAPAPAPAPAPPAAQEPRDVPPTVDPRPVAIGDMLADQLEAEGRKKTLAAAPGAPPAVEPPKPTPAPAPAAPAPAAPAPATPTPKPPPVVRRQEPAPAPTPEPPKPVPVPEKPKTHADLIGAEVSEEVADYLDTVKFADENDPRFKGAYEKETARLKAMHQKRIQWEKDHPGETLKPGDEEMQEIVKAHPPTLTATEQRALERRRVVAEANKAADEKITKQQREYDRKLAAMEVRPRLERIDKDTADAIQEVLPERLKERAKAGLDAIASDPEGEVAVKLARRAQGMQRTFLQIRSGAVEFDRENKDHMGIATFVEQAGRFYKAEAARLGENDKLVKDGKSFVTMAEMARMRAEGDPKIDDHWTWEDEDVVQVMIANAREGTKLEIAAKRKALEAAGYVPATTPSGAPPAAPASPAPGDPPPMEPSPRSDPAPSGGGSPGTKPKGNPLTRHMFAE